MLIILESSDCCGKTTFAKYLSSVQGFTLITTPRKPGPVADFAQADSFDEFLLQRVHTKDHVYVLDRHTPSNYAYGTSRNEPAGRLAKYLLKWDNFVKEAGPGLCTIWLTRSPKAIQDDLIKLTKEQDYMVLNAYKRLAIMQSEPMFNLVEQKHTYANIMDYIWLKLNLN